MYRRKSAVVLWLVLACFLVSGFHALTLQSGDPIVEARNVDLSAPQLEPSEVLLVDSATYEVVGPPAQREFHKALNTPEKIQERRLATMVIENPDNYKKLHPKTRERETLEDETAFSVKHPEQYDAKMRPLKTPERLALEAKAGFGIQRPREFCAEYLEKVRAGN